MAQTFLSVAGLLFFAGVGGRHERWSPGFSRSSILACDQQHRLKPGLQHQIACQTAAEKIHNSGPFSGQFAESCRELARRAHQTDMKRTKIGAFSPVEKRLLRNRGRYGPASQSRRRETKQRVAQLDPDWQ